MIAVQGDADLLGQVIQNLAGNAVKFSQGESPITLTLGSNGQHVELCISNRGPAIPERDRNKIFERFYRADKARSRRIDGAGLGLSLAREIAHAHGGTLELADDSKEGEVTFRLRLPAEITEP
jgi:two-component system heavy metal sensor histidine kinase CusS